MKRLLQQQVLLSGRLPRAVSFLYMLLLLSLAGAIVLSFYLQLDVVVKASGMLRPAKENVEIRAGAAGLIDSIQVSEGQFVKKGDRIALIKDGNFEMLADKLHGEMKRKLTLLSDLEVLIQLKQSHVHSLPELQTGIFREEFLQFWISRRKLETNLAQAMQEWKVSLKLINERIIAPAEHALKTTLFQVARNNLDAGWHQQKAAWNNRKLVLTDEISQLEQDLERIRSGKQRQELVAPVSGTIWGIRHRYNMVYLQTAEPICSIIPETILIAECLVNATDIGYIRQQQAVKFRVDAFDPQQFGLVHGNIQFIDPDFTSMNTGPVFKVRCSIRQNSLILKNGYEARLKKGMTVQARFIIVRRTLWQLFSDKIHNWLVPAVTV